MIYQVRHRTVVRYHAPVRLARFNVRLRPADWPTQRVENYRLDVSPEPSLVETRPGAYPVNLSRLIIDDSLARLVIDSHFTVEVLSPAAVPAMDDPTVAQVAREALAINDLGPQSPANFLFASLRAPMVPAIGQWAAAGLSRDRGIVDAGLALCRRIRDEFTYDPAATDADTAAEAAFAERHGVCQDFAHIMVIALRMAGLPAAYVSGYLRTDPPPGAPRLVGADATHAWVMLWCGRARGWIGFDPTNGVAMGTDHIFMAMGRDYADVTPMDGMFVGNAGQSVDVMVDVTSTD